MFQILFTKYSLAMVDFFGGLVFFLMGFVIILQFLQYYQKSNLKLVSSVWLLSLFGLLHGTAKWFNFFLSFVFNDLPGDTFYFLKTTAVIFTALSFICLYLFGVELLVSTFKKYYYLRLTAIVVTLLWLSIFLLSYPRELNVWLDEGLAWSYFLLAFPGAILVSLALITQITDFSKLRIPKLSKAIYGATASFMLYGVSTGMLLPNWSNFFSAIPNGTAVFPEPTPALQFFRGLCGIGMAYFILLIMQIFNLENNKKLELAKTSQAVLEERDRISRDLHDGVIQSLYGIGLSMEIAINKINPNPCSNQLEYVMNGLNETIASIRNYIQGLNPVEKHTYTLQEAISALIRELSSHTNLTINVDWHDQDQHQLTSDQVDHIYHIVRESLYNVAKHSQATEANIKFEISGNQLILYLVDNGIGIKNKSKISSSQRGLRNIYERVEQLDGTTTVESKEGAGTSIKISVPLEVRR